METVQFHSENLTEYAKAMMNVQKALEPLSKNEYSSYTNSRYATLPKVMEACLKPLCDNGFFLTQYTRSTEPGSIYLVTRILHVESGQFLESHLNMPAPRNDPQAYGSALTYARRYGLQVAVGIVCEDDDDGNKARAAMEGNAAQTGQSDPQNGAQKQGSQPKKPPRGKQSSPPPDKSAHSSQSLPEYVQTTLASLPELNGVRYVPEEREGVFYITAKGNTRSREKMLTGAGFQLGSKTNTWFMMAKAA